MRFRLATLADVPSLAKSRWDFRAEDGETPLVTREEFLQHFAQVVTAEMEGGRLAYWVAELDEQIVAQMAVFRIVGIPRPSRASDQWGYLTDCYTRPDHRGAGVGSRLLAHVREWAAQQDFELLLVSPSEAGESFYRRAGFGDADLFRQLTLRAFDREEQE